MTGARTTCGAVDNRGIPLTNRRDEWMLEFAKNDDDEYGFAVSFRELDSSEFDSWFELAFIPVDRSSLGWLTEQMTAAILDGGEAQS